MRSFMAMVTGGAVVLSAGVCAAERVRDAEAMGRAGKRAAPLAMAHTSPARFSRGS